MTKRAIGKYWIIHDGRVICDVSDPILDLWRCTRAELIGVNIFDIIPSPELRELARLRVNHILTKGADLHDQDLPVSRPDGTTFWINVITIEIYDGVYLSELTYMGEHNPNWHNT